MANRTLYTARVHVLGGRSGRGRSDDGILDVDLERPKELGGEGGGTNPEQLFAVGYAACFLGALDVAARSRRLPVEDSSIGAEVSLTKAEDGHYGIAARLDLSLPSVGEEDAARELALAAHELCAYSNATRGNVAVVLTVNGSRLDDLVEASHAGRRGEAAP